MAKISQHQLLSAHDDAHYSAEQSKLKRQREGEVSRPPVLDRTLPVPQQPYSPFGGNDNNRRVAERIVREGVKTKPEPKRLDKVEAAQAALDLHESLNDHAQPTAQDLSEPESDTGNAEGEKDSKAPKAPANAPTWSPKA